MGCECVEVAKSLRGLFACKAPPLTSQKLHGWTVSEVVGVFLEGQAEDREFLPTQILEQLICLIFFNQFVR